MKQKQTIIALLTAPLLIVITSFTLSAQVIVTVAGNNSFSGPIGDGGPATSATLWEPEGINFDAAGNLYISEEAGNTVRKVNTSGIISTVAGSGGAFNIVNAAPATTAGFDHPMGIVLDAAGNLYIGSTLQYMIFKVTPAGTIYFFSGDDTCGYTGDGGSCVSARIGQPQGMATDTAGNIYFTDFVHNVVRKINTAGIISTFAGTSIPGYSGDGGPATAAEINGVEGIATDKNGNVYFSDDQNGYIRKVDAAGIITTIAGTGTVGFSGDGGPATAAQINSGTGKMVVDGSGNVYLSDNANYRIRKITPAGIITTIAGNGTMTFAGDGCAPTATGMWPAGLAFDASGTLYYADFINQAVRKISTASTGISNVSTGEMHVYPNPGSGTFTVNVPSIENTLIDLSVTDMTGRNVEKITVHTNQNERIELNAPQGIYVISGNTSTEVFNTTLTVLK